MLRAPSLRPVQVVLVGNCVDRGLGLRPGESYADQVRESVQSRHPETPINSRAICDELGAKYQLHTVFPTEVLNERFDGLLQETARERLNASGHHRLIGPIDSAVETTVCAVLRDRAGGEIKLPDRFRPTQQFVAVHRETIFEHA